jgi:hypothetical protein
VELPEVIACACLTGGEVNGPDRKRLEVTEGQMDALGCAHAQPEVGVSHPFLGFGFPVLFSGFF